MSLNLDSIPFAPDHPLFGPSLKIERAKSHIIEIEAEISAFLKRGPYTVHADDDPKTGDKVFRVRINEPVPIGLGALIGDAIHNLRASFDLISCQIVSIGKKDISQAQFPINMRPDRFESAGLRKIDGAPDHAVEIVRRLQPYQGGGNDVLWAIHKLDVLDKHRLIIPVGSAYKSFGLDFNKLMASHFEKMGKPAPKTSIPAIHIRPANRQFPLNDGATIFIVRAAARDTKLDNDTQFAFEVAFGEGQIVDGEPIVPTLNQFVQFTENTIRIFADEVFV